MVESPPRQPALPRISALQRAWLEELGLDAPLLAPGLVPDDPPTVPSGRAARTGEATARVEDAGDHFIDVGPRHRAQRVGGHSAGADSRQRGGAEGEAWPRAAPAGELETLRRQVEQCRACGLCEGRSHAVFGEGVARAPDWMVVGEAPGDCDDRSGRPFQGEAGALLANMLSAVGIVADDQVYATNLVKCRPLGNRPPLPEEIAACLPYLRQQVVLLAPRLILAVGRVAAQTLTGSQSTLSQLRGRVHAFKSPDGRQIPLVVTHHPASLLLQPQHKLDAWRDLVLARRAVR